MINDYLMLLNIILRLFTLKNYVWNPCMRTLSIPTRKEWPLRVELRRDASHGPNVDRRGVVGRSQEDLGGAVPRMFQIQSAAVIRQPKMRWSFFIVAVCL